MVPNPKHFFEQWPTTSNAAKARNPDIPKAFGAFFGSLMKEGALTVREKELVALGIGLAARCEPCIYLHVQKCIEAGATPEQIMEAAGVAVMMGGGPMYTYVPAVAAALDQLTAAKPH